MRERKNQKKKISGGGVMVKGKWPYYYVMTFFFLEYYLQRRTMEIFQGRQLQLKFHSLIQMKLKWAILNNGRKYNS
jgi:hypothetical protein